MAQRLPAAAGRRPGAPDAAAEALEANRVLVMELQGLVQSLTREETRLKAKTQAIRRRMALRRAQQAMDALLPRATSAAPSSSLLSYEKSPRNRLRSSGVVPRSYIRKQPSYFSDEAEGRKKTPVGRRPKKKAKTAGEPYSGDAITSLQRLPEPPANSDALFLRARSHEAFVATAAPVFSAKERQVVRDFAQNYYSSHPDSTQIPLTAWNELQTWQRSRSSKQLALERSGFACKLWYDLHEAPDLRLSAWTKQEDAALRRLATGQEDPKLVNQWHEIAERMPVPGRPATHCLTRFQTTLCSGNVRSSFSPDEDSKLREAVGVFGEKWAVIADLLDGRLPEQLRHRWQQSLAPGVRQGKFSIVEDRRLLLALRAYLPKDLEFKREQVAWHDVTHHVPGRTQPALRDRFLNTLNPELSFRRWTKREDEVILARVQDWGLEAFGLWSRLAAELGDRSDNQVARRWKVIAPEASEQRRQAQQLGGRAATTAVFRRPTSRRRDPRRTASYVKRSSYNGQDSHEEEGLESPEAASQVAEAESQQEPIGEAVEQAEDEQEGHQDGWSLVV
ncbi:hypothetical protein BBJ28_00011439 [Nothophytophthora sp. Chile5]|nr:hypothetical protein BBJ28_00011439 [Nothophytophthora sp. Chile5]